MVEDNVCTIWNYEKFFTGLSWVGLGQPEYLVINSKRRIRKDPQEDVAGFACAL